MGPCNTWTHGVGCAVAGTRKPVGFGWTDRVQEPRGVDRPTAFSFTSVDKH